jgi:hypothetical protein
MSAVEGECQNESRNSSGKKEVVASGNNSGEDR